MRSHFLSYFGPDLPKIDKDESPNGNYDLYRYIHREELYKDYLLEETFTVRRLYAESKEPRLSVSELDNYAQDIRKSVELYYQIIYPEDGPFNDTEKILLQRLARNGREDSRLLALVILQTTKESDRRTAVFNAMERYAFLAQMKPYSFREVQVTQLAIKLKATHFTPEDIVRNFESNCKKFVDSNEFVEALRNIGKSDGYYGWASLRYFMFEYEQDLRKNSKTARQILSWDSFRLEDFDSDHKSIEHIYPQRALDQYWKDQFAKYTVPERNILRNSLGNLLPVSLPKNSSLSNKAFKEKCGSVVNQVGYSYGCLSEIQVAQQSTWNALSIAARGLHLISFMEKRWGFSLGTEEKMLDVLGLSFVLSREGVDIKRLKESYISSV